MQGSRKIRVAIGAAVSALLMLIAVVPALASSSGAALAPVGANVSFANTANATSTSFGGWVFTPSGATSATATFKIPSLTCSSTTTGVGPGTFMETGSTSAPNFNGAGVLLECSGGSPAAEALDIVDGVYSVSSSPLFVGDLMKATVTTSATKTVATIRDLTHKFVLTKSGAGAASVEEFLMDDSLTSSGTQLPLADFGKIHFGAGAISGTALGSVTPQTKVNMETSAKVLQIVTGLLSGTTKNGFLTTWKHS